MKQKDLAIIIAVVVASTIFSYVICSRFITPPKNQQEKVEVVDKISADFKLPDTKIFNSSAVNPTKLIEIGPNSNKQPFVNQ